jgi:hypothetical protein
MDGAGAVDLQRARATDAKDASGTATILEDGFTISRVNPFIGGNAT